MLFVTPAVSTRQQSSIDAHVQRMRSAAASSPAAILKGIQSTHDRSSNADGQAVSRRFRTLTKSVIDGRQPSEVSQSDRYRSLFGRPVDIVRNMLKTSPVQDVEPAASIVDTESAAETCSEDSKSDSGYQSDSGSEGSIESSATSILDSDSESLAYLPEIAEVSICNDAEREDLRKQLDHSQHQLYLQQIEYRDLDEKYKVQIAQRKADHATVMDAYTRFENAQAYSRQLEQQRKAIIQVNDRKTSRLECNHRAAISAMARAHRMELKIQNDTIAKLHAELSAKDEVLAQVKVVSVTAVEARITALVNELDQKDRKIQEMKAANTIKDNTIEQAEAVKDKVQLKLREMVEAAEMNRKTWAEEKEKLSSNAYQARLDHQDSLQAQQVEIVRLTRDNHRLELEKNALSMTVSQHRDEEFTCLRDTFNECETMRKELATANRKIIILKEKDKNILESMPQERDYWEKNYEKEKIAQDECRQLQIKLFVAQESIEHRDDRIRDLEADLQASRNPARNSGDRLDTVQKLVLDNDELRAKIDMLEQEKADIQKALDMKDNENFGIICNAHVQEAELRKLKASHDILQYTY
jgi:hypothetical protein